MVYARFIANEIILDYSEAADFNKQCTLNIGLFYLILLNYLNLRTWTLLGSSSWRVDIKNTVRFSRQNFQILAYQFHWDQYRRRFITNEMIHSINLFSQPKLPICIFIKSGVSIFVYPIIISFARMNSKQITEKQQDSMGITFCPFKVNHWVALYHTSCYKQYQIG